jgi:acetyl/propionyl-CoA carboxylase alpha subunit
VKAARAVDYVNAGTVEFIADARDGLRADRIWFMEMNTRLQVEHPVTEEITGLDLVEWQLRVASGEKLPLKQDEIKMRGHAIEARLYAEDPSNGFLPSVGRLEIFALPWQKGDRARLESAVGQGDEISAHYDPMIAKIIMHGSSRDAAISEFLKEWNDVLVWPVKTNAGFIARCLRDVAFRVGDVDTGFTASRGEALAAKPTPSEFVVARAAGGFLSDARRLTPWTALRGFRLNAEASGWMLMRHQGALIQVEAVSIEPSWPERDGNSVLVFEDGEVFAFELETGEVTGSEAATGDGAIRAPMPGRVVAVNAKKGAKVKKGEALVTLEAMKMEHALVAPFDGKVVELNTQAGAQVSEGAVLAKLEKD